MAASKKIRQEVKKRFNWYGSLAVPKKMNDPRAFARLQSLHSRLLEDSVLRVDANIRLFVVGNVAQSVVSEDEQPAIRKVNRDIETTTFIRLRNVDSVRDVVSIRHDIRVDKVSYRGDRVSVIGAMSLMVSYLSDVVLEGTVIEFPKGNPVNGATVKVKDMDSGKLLVSTSTGPDGTYAFADIDPGTFTVEVEAEGFQREERAAVVMLKDTVDFTLHKIIDDAFGVDLKSLEENLGAE